MMSAIVSGGAVPSTAMRKQHAEAVLFLTVGRAAPAVQRLRAVAESSGDPSVWNDLAVAEAAAARIDDDGQEAFAALAAADTAVRLAPDLGAAQFNRAMALEAIGLREAAATAWERVRFPDPNDPRAHDPEQRLRRLRSLPTDADRWAAAAKRIDQFDDAQLLSIVRAVPEGARRWGEGVFLSAWGQAYIDGDDAEAARNLDSARRIGRALRVHSGERLLAESVEAIDTARQDKHRLARLAEGHVAYRTGRMSYGRHEYGPAGKQLEMAQRAFASGRSPMADLAAYYVDMATYSRNEIPRASAGLERLLTEQRAKQPQRRSLIAQILWGIALCDSAMGRWTGSIDASAEALGYYERLGERANAAAIHVMLAEAFDFVGDRSRASQHTLAAIRLASAAGDRYRVVVALGVASRGAIRREQWRSARAIAAIQLSLADKSMPRHLVAYALGHLAMAEDRLGNRAAADQALARAGLVVCRIEDETLRAKLDGSLEALAGAILRERHPLAARARLSQSIDFNVRSGRTFVLPELYLERGRCSFAAGDERAALDDFDRGVAELERQRHDVHDVALRVDLFNDTRGLFTDSVDVALRQGAVERAFSYAERGRARALLDIVGKDGELAVRSAAGTSLHRLQSELPPRTVLLEYVSLGDALVIFSIDRTSRTVATVPVSGAEIERAVQELFRSISRSLPRAGTMRLARRLHEILIQPVETRLRGAETVIFVADGVLQRVPFAALVNRHGSFFVERYASAVEPSAAVYMEMNGRYRFLVSRRPRPGKVAVVANPAFSRSSAGSLQQLRFAEKEGDRVAELYPHATILRGSGATAANFARIAPRSDIIHFAGHASVNAADPARSALLLAGSGLDGDGALDTGSLQRIRLDETRLAVLSACSTLRGYTTGLEGMPSIVRGFIGSGVPAVVGTLWDIEDARAGDIALPLHGKVAGGTAPAAALRKAQLAALRSTDAVTSDPATWAAFTLVGATGD